MNGWGWFALACAAAAGFTALGALALWAAGEPPDAGRTASLVAGLASAALVSSGLMRK